MNWCSGEQCGPWPSCLCTPGNDLLLFPFPGVWAVSSMRWPADAHCSRDPLWRTSSTISSRFWERPQRRISQESPKTRSSCRTTSPITNPKTSSTSLQGEEMTDVISLSPLSLSLSLSLSFPPFSLSLSFLSLQHLKLFTRVVYVSVLSL